MGRPSPPNILPRTGEGKVDDEVVGNAAGEGLKETGTLFPQGRAPDMGPNWLGVSKGAPVAIDEVEGASGLDASSDLGLCGFMGRPLPPPLPAAPPLPPPNIPNPFNTPDDPPPPLLAPPPPPLLPPPPPLPPFDPPPPLLGSLAANICFTPLAIASSIPASWRPSNPVSRSEIISRCQSFLMLPVSSLILP